MRRAWPLSAAVLAIAAPSQGEERTGFAVGRYEPAERGSPWLVVDALDLRGRTRPAFGLTLDEAYKPLVVYDAARNERYALVRHQLFAHLGGAVVLRDRLRLGANVPFALYQDGEAAVVGGETLKAATAPALGDVRLAADLRALGVNGDPFAVAVGLRGWLPTGLRSQFTGDGAARVAPQVLVAGELGGFVWAARAAYVHRFRDDAYAGSALGSELAGAIGAGVREGPFLVGVEVFAATRLDDPFGDHTSPADALLGVHHESPSGLRISAAIGAGLSHGYGSPALRALVSIGWGTPVPAAPPDRDRDAIADSVDACPDRPGVASGDPELHGCPPPERVPDEDTDGDGIRDGDDACPGLAGVSTPDPMTNGCPRGAPRQLAVVTPTEIRIGEQIQFATDSADLLGGSDGVLEAVARLLEEHPEVRRVRVEGHTDDRGDPDYNDDLSLRRAAAVVRWLVARGIAEDRLASKGWGSRRPLETNATEAGRATNRRVVFTIVARDPRR